MISKAAAIRPDLLYGVDPHERTKLVPFCNVDTNWEQIPPNLVETYRADPLYFSGEITWETPEFENPPEEGAARDP